MDPIPTVLALLAEGPVHGYEIKTVADRELKPFWRIDFGQLYRVLHRAAGERLIATFAPVRSGRGPDRRRYRLTIEGRRALAAWFAKVADDDDELMVKLALAARGAGDVGVVIAANRGSFSARSAAARAAYRRACGARDRVRILVGDAALRRAEACEAALALAGNSIPARAMREQRTGATRPARGGSRTATLRIAGSDDPLFGWLTRTLGFTTQIVGSYGGIWALRQRDADAAALHLQDADTREYNAPFVRHLLPEGDWVLVNVAWRENGLIVARGNPRRIRGVCDLARRSVRIVNRQPDAGTRVLLMRELHREGIDPASVRGFGRCVTTHGAVADTIALGLADAGPGLRAAAAARGLDFVPLASERYDIALPRDVFDSRRAQDLFDALCSRAFRDEAARLQGYDLRDCGRIVAEARPQQVRP